MSKKSLSDLGIRNMKVGSSATDTNENRGLIVSKTKLGKVTFYYRYEEIDTKKGVKMKIGDYPNMSLAVARVEVQRLKNLRQSGISPRQEKQDDIQRKKEEMILSESVAFTMKDLVDYYLSHHIEDRKVNGKIIKGARQPKGQYEVRTILYSSIVKDLGGISINEIKVDEILQTINTMLARGVNVQAGNTVRELNSAYEYAIGTGKLPENFINPMISIKRRLKYAKQRLTHEKGSRHFSDSELQKFLAWLPESHFLDNAKNIFMLTLYTGCRTGEWCAAHWDNINLDAGFFKIVLTKTKTSRHVQLSHQAIDLLRKIKELKSDGYLFVSSRTGKPLEQKKLTEYTWVLRQNNQMIDLERWSPHDLRRTVRTGLSRLGCPSVVAEAIIGHSKKGIEGTYDLHTYDSECKVWLQKWCDHLDELEGGNE